MLHAFLAAHRTQLIDRCRLKVAERPAHPVEHANGEHGVARFLDQVIRTLEVEQTSAPMRSRMISGASGGSDSGASEIGETAARHGSELFKAGMSVDQVVHAYGDLCQAITDLAFEHRAAIKVDEFRTLNRCLDNAIAVAVTEFENQRELGSEHQRTDEVNQRLGFLAHELRNMLGTATLALTVIKSGNVGWTGATGAVLDRSLLGLRQLIDRSLTEVRIAAGSSAQRQLVSLKDFIEDVRVFASLEAQQHECTLSVPPVDPALGVYADQHLLSSALSNVLQNAFKFTKYQSAVTLKARAAGDRVLIEVEDRCGGLAPGDIERMFLPFAQTGTDTTGLGLGLTLSRRGVEANDGTLRARDIPGSGCVFTISLPRRTLPMTSPLATPGAASSPSPRS